VGQRGYVVARHHEHVPLEHRPGVEEADRRARLEDDLGGHLAGDDAAEQTLHAPMMARRAPSPGATTYRRIAGAARIWMVDGATADSAPGATAKGRADAAARLPRTRLQGLGGRPGPRPEGPHGRDRQGRDHHD